MGTIRDLLVKAPILCRAENAGRFSALNALGFDAEKDGGTVFDRNDIDVEKPFNRIQVAFGFTAFPHDVGRAQHCMVLARLYELAHYRDEHGDNSHDGEIADLWATCSEKEAEYPDIAEVMTADAAAEDGGW